MDSYLEEPLDSSSNSDHSSPGESNGNGNSNWLDFGLQKSGGEWTGFLDSSGATGLVGGISTFWSTPGNDILMDDPLREEMNRPTFDPGFDSSHLVHSLLSPSISPHLTSVPLPFSPSDEIAKTTSIFGNSKESPVTENMKQEGEDYEDESEELEEQKPIARVVTSKPMRRAAPLSTNLVAKDAFVASTVIPSISKPALSTLSEASGLRMLVLGVPLIGAKSRVETQIKISVVLVRSLQGSQFDEEGLMTADGGIDSAAGQSMERIGTWSHIKLPQFLALKKKKAKKAPLPDPPLNETLFLEVAVIGSSQPAEEIFICTGCRQREHKRSQRKKEARVRPVIDLEGGDGAVEEEEKRKVVVFNCPEFVEFHEGEVVLPTRITCYCRHHKEKNGFSVSFIFRDHLGAIVAQSATPPIMITDDHKTNGARQSTSTSTDLSFSGSATAKAKRARPTKVEVEEDIVPADRPKRSNSRSKAARGMVESEDELCAATTSNLIPSSRPTIKPYDTDSRPRKRSSGVHRSPGFAMTPLPLSVIGSPISTSLEIPESVSSLPSPSNTYESNSSVSGWPSSLGLGDIRPNSQSNLVSTAPSPANSQDWHSAASPPFSPGGINIPHTVESYTPYGHLSRNGSSSSLSQLHQAHLSGHQQQLQSVDAGSFAQQYDPASMFANIAPWNVPVARPSQPPPRISRLIPGAGPVHGGIEVTVLGENFVRDLVCVFGDSPAMTTHFWSANTLICILPPSANPGPVVVGIKGLPLTVDEGTGLQLFTYRDDSDRSLLELALQVVGLKMTGRLEDAKNVAMRIVGSSAINSSATAGRGNSPTQSGLAMSMAAATAAVYATPSNSRPSSRPSSRRSSIDLSTSQPIPWTANTSTPLNFEAIVMRFLTLLDLDPSQIPGSAPSVPLTQSPISHSNAQRHSLLHLATVLGFHRLSQFLISRSCDINSPDRNGYTPLHFAALYGRVAITRQLLDAGAASYSRNRAGKTAHEIARDRDDVDVEELFLRSRAPLVAGTRRQYFASTSSNNYARTPNSLYSRSEASESESDSSDEDGDDSPFFSSDEEELVIPDIERGISRNNSIVSLYHLLDAEADALQEEEEEEEGSAVEVSRIYKPSGWLARTFSPTIIFPARAKGDDSTTATKAVWEKVPRIGIPEVIAFPWTNSSIKKPALHLDSTPSSITEKSKDWKSLYGPWWQAKTVDRAASPPPPMYSPTDNSPAVPSPSTSTMKLPPLPTLATYPPTRAQMKAKIARRVGYAPEDISDRVASSYLHHEKTMKNLKYDKMLYVFWIPCLLLVLAWATFSVRGLVKPGLELIVEALLPFAKAIKY